MRRALSILSSCGLLIAVAPSSQSQDRLYLQGPPPNAFLACEHHSQGESCTIEGPNAQMTGSCRTDRRREALVCMADRHIQPQGQSGARTRHGPGGGSGRDHRTTQSPESVSLYPATTPPITATSVETWIEGSWRFIRSNSVSDHPTGQFPNPGNPHAIDEFALSMRVPATPRHTGVPTPVKVPGIAINGVSFDPGAGEFYRGDPSSGWQYEALSGAIALGLDTNHAHVQPTGKYHYHGLPTALIQTEGRHTDGHSKQIGWAADGFPIYAQYGYASADTRQVVALKSSYRLKSGPRPTGGNQPGGTYDGTFTSDWEYVAGLGDLDECNGKITVTPDAPKGTYAYFLTETYPVVPRCVMGTPDTLSQRNDRPPSRGRAR